MNVNIQFSVMEELFGSCRFIVWTQHRLCKKSLDLSSSEFTIQPLSTCGWAISPLPVWSVQSGNNTQLTSQACWRTNFTYWFLKVFVKTVSHSINVISAIYSLPLGVFHLGNLEYSHMSRRACPHLFISWGGWWKIETTNTEFKRIFFPFLIVLYLVSIYSKDIQFVPNESVLGSVIWRSL